jgi:RND family efflux transporter MFP subunit
MVRMHQELPPGSAVYTIADTRRMSVMVGIPESELGGVGEGSEAMVSVSVLGTRVWKAAVRRLSREIAKSNRVAQAELVIDNPDGAIKAGMTARVNLTRVSYDNALVVPTDAIRNQAGESYLMVAQQGKALRRTVRLGVSDQRFTVVEEGLEQGMQVIIEGQHLVNDGTPLVIHN